jgi:hypothetical protein
LYVKGSAALCRRCLNLAYDSQRLGKIDRARRRLEEARERLGADARRPKGMHRRTWERLKREYLEAAEDLEAAHQERLERLAASARRRRARQTSRGFRV